MLTHERHCPAHKRQERRQYARSRPSSAAQGYGHEWRRASRQFRRDNPLCIECRKAGRLVVIDALQDFTLGMDENNGREIAPAVHRIRRIAEELGCAVWLLHHLNKADSLCEKCPDAFR
jgi:5-methylcytosine-specific restriction protein A